MTKSYSQKADLIFRILKANPETSASKIYERYKGTEYGMRKTDALELIKGFKSQLKAKDDFMKKVNNSDMLPSTKTKLSKAADRSAYKNAKYNTRRGKKENKKGIIYSSVQSLDARTFARRMPSANDFYEFYGE